MCQHELINFAKLQLRYYILLGACLSVFVINNNSDTKEFLDLCGYTETPLMKATKIADIQEIYKLIQTGENVNAVYGSDFPRAGDPVLVYAINSKSLEAVSILLKADANPNDFTNSSSMIYEADAYMNCRNIPLDDILFAQFFRLRTKITGSLCNLLFRCNDGKNILYGSFSNCCLHRFNLSCVILAFTIFSSNSVKYMLS